MVVDCGLAVREFDLVGFVGLIWWVSVVFGSMVFLNGSGLLHCSMGLNGAVVGCVVGCAMS